VNTKLKVKGNVSCFLFLSHHALVLYFDGQS